VDKAIFPNAGNHLHCTKVCVASPRKRRGWETTTWATGIFLWITGRLCQKSSQAYPQLHFSTADKAMYAPRRVKKPGVLGRARGFGPLVSGDRG